MKQPVSVRFFSVLFVLLLVTACGGGGGSSSPAVASISVSPGTATINVGSTQQLTASAQDSGGSAISGTTFTWSSSDSSVLTVNSSGVVTAVAPGTATITAMSGSITGTATITANPLVASVSVSPSSATLAPNATQTLTATAKDSSGNAISNASFTYKSSDTSIATVNSSGVVTAVAAGSATITATSSGVSGTSAFTVASPTAVTGTAATGAPIAGTTVTLVDSTGKTATATTASDGTFSINTTGMTPPFMIKITVAATNVTLYSVSADASNSTVINVDPLTDLIIRSWYSAQGNNIDTAFADPVSAPPPTPTQVQIISDVVLKVVQLWLNNAGVDTSNFNLISTAFNADGTGVDKVLDMTKVDTNTGKVTVTDTSTSTTQTTTVSYDSNTGSIQVATSTTNASGTSTSSTTTTIPTTSVESTAFSAIESQLKALANVVNTKGAQLSASDVTPFISSTFLNDGDTGDIYAAQIATDIRGGTIQVTLLNMDSLDTTKGTAHVTVQTSQTVNQQTQYQQTEFYFINSGGTWLINGDQRLARIQVKAEMRIDKGPTFNNVGPDINIDVEAPQNSITSVTANGAVFNNTNVALGNTRVVTLQPQPGGTSTTYYYDAFYAGSGTLTSPVATGTPITITVTPASGSAQTYTTLVNAFTNDPVTITSPTVNTLADANLGQPLTVTWTLPTTYPIATIVLDLQAFDGDQTLPGTDECGAPSPVLSANATTGTITAPTTCNGNPVVQVDVNLSTNGVNGERSFESYEFAN